MGFPTICDISLKKYFSIFPISNQGTRQPNTPTHTLNGTALIIWQINVNLSSNVVLVRSMTHFEIGEYASLNSIN